MKSDTDKPRYRHNLAASRYTVEGWKTREQRFALTPLLKTPKPWQEWLELNIRLTNIPAQATTYDINRRFSMEGDIIFVEIFEGRDGRRDGGARIRYSQPPVVRPFWDSQVTIEVGREKLLANIHVAVEPQKRSFQIQSPIRKQTWYKEQMSLDMSGIDFGFMSDPSNMRIMYTVNPSGPPKVFMMQSLLFKVDLLRQKLELKFPVLLADAGKLQEAKNADTLEDGAGDRVDTYKFEIPFKQLHHICLSEVGDNQWGMTISVESPPRFFRKLRHLRSSHGTQELMWSERDIWFRTTDIVQDPSKLSNQAVSLDKERSIIDIGKWTTYQMVFDKEESVMLQFEEMKQAFRDWNIEVITSSIMASNQGSRAEFWSLIKQTRGDYPHSLSLIAKSLPFEVMYQLQVCISQGVLNEHSLTVEFLDRLCELSSQDQVRARCILEYFAEDGSRVFEPLSIFSSPEALQYSPHTSIPRYCAYTRKATITPTCLLLSTPTVETSNRVVRQFSAYNDRFLRVQFTDEKAEGRINACADKNVNDEVFTRVFRTLLNGIVIGDRHYEFLAFGNSQFRENGAYFFCPAPDLSCGDIRKWMGDFSNILVPAKYAARLGLCFSTTRAIHGVNPTLKRLEDVERNGFCFTDGVGKISEVLARTIALELQLPMDVMAPSAFQFRLGGCKGMLTVWPDVKGYEIMIRNSQQKFAATYSGLEIIRWSKLSMATLNRQTITILSALGVPDQIFNRKLMEQLSNYQKAMTDKVLALELLYRYIDDNLITTTIASMVHEGFMTAKEPFVMSLLHLWRSWSIKLLKEKAKIIIEKGAFIFGVVDETGVLKGHRDATTEFPPESPRSMEDLPQIFLQVSNKNKKGDSTVIQGICVVGRNPSLHPGDLRVVEAVDCPPLRHLQDVVVFPQQGDRDIPGMCSGGDLDGDDFFVIWDSDLIPPKWNVEPMSYVAPKPVELEKKVKIPDLMKFFVKYMKNDALPTIAHAHLAQSDYLSRGVEDDKCLRLAALHSKAVDYVKTGVSAQMEKDLKPRKWPHFMEKIYTSKEAQYVSHKILGQLYDKVERVSFLPQYTESFDPRILDAYPIHSENLRKARKLKTKYDTAMLRIMAQHEIGTEFEVWSAFVLTKPRTGSDYKLQEEMGIVSQALKDRFRQNVVEEVGASDHGSLAPFVAAMYRVTYEEMQLALEECSSSRLLGGLEVPVRRMEPKYMPLISFPWLFPEILGGIASGSQWREDIGKTDLRVIPTARKPGNRPRETSAADVDFEVYVETVDGIIHRGEKLDLFHQDDIDSEGDAIQQFDEIRQFGLKNGAGIDHTLFSPSQRVDAPSEQKIEAQQRCGSVGDLLGLDFDNKIPAIAKESMSDQGIAGKEDFHDLITFDSGALDVDSNRLRGSDALAVTHNDDHVKCNEPSSKACKTAESPSTEGKLEEDSCNSSSNNSSSEFLDALETVEEDSVGAASDTAMSRAEPSEGEEGEEELVVLGPISCAADRLARLHGL